jgi:hypothetical protein
MPNPNFASDVPKSFTFALFRDDWQREHAVTERGYDEVATSIFVEVAGKPGHGLFIHSQTFRDRLVKLGWLDVTETFKKAAEAPPAAPAEPPAKRRAASAA